MQYINSNLSTRRYDGWWVWKTVVTGIPFSFLFQPQKGCVHQRKEQALLEATLRCCWRWCLESQGKHSGWLDVPGHYKMWRGKKGFRKIYRSFYLYTSLWSCGLYPSCCGIRQLYSRKICFKCILMCIYLHSPKKHLGAILFRNSLDRTEKNCQYSATAKFAIKHILNIVFLFLIMWTCLQTVKW